MNALCDCFNATPKHSSNLILQLLFLSYFIKCYTVQTDVNTTKQPSTSAVFFNVCFSHQSSFTQAIKPKKKKENQSKGVSQQPLLLRKTRLRLSLGLEAAKGFKNILRFKKKNGRLKLFLFIDKSKPKKTFFCT